MPILVSKTPASTSTYEPLYTAPVGGALVAVHVCNRSETDEAPFWLAYNSSGTDQPPAKNVLARPDVPPMGEGVKGGIELGEGQTLMIRGGSTISVTVIGV